MAIYISEGEEWQFISQKGRSGNLYLRGEEWQFISQRGEWQFISQRGRSGNLYLRGGGMAIYISKPIDFIETKTCHQ